MPCAPVSFEGAVPKWPAKGEEFIADCALSAIEDRKLGTGIV